MREGAFTMPNRFALRFLNRQMEIETTASLDEFMEMTKRFHELFAIPRYEGYQVWYDNGGLWESVHGVKDPMFILFAEMIQDVQPSVDNSEEIGKAVIENYRLWRNEVADIEKNGQRRKYDESLLIDLKSRMDVIHKALRDLKADLKEVNVFAIFTFLIDNQKVSVTQKEQRLHVSKTTVWRQENLFLKLLGAWILNRIHGEKFDSLICPYENHREIGPQSYSQQNMIKPTISAVRSEVQSFGNTTKTISTGSY